MKSKKKTCNKKIVKMSLIEDKVFRTIMEILKDGELVRAISEKCYSMQSTENPEIPILKK